VETRQWNPKNGWALSKVAAKYGWPTVEVHGHTVAHETERDILWVEGGVADWLVQAALRQLG